MASKVVSSSTLMEFLKNSKGFDRIMAKVRVISFGKGKCLCEMKVEEEHTNSMGTLHGGLSATLVDTLSSFTLMAQKDGAPNVSVNMNITYMKEAKMGEDIVIEAKSIRAGRYLSFLEADIRNKQSGETSAKCWMLLCNFTKKYWN